MTQAELRYLQEVRNRALGGPPPLEDGEAIVDELLRATLRARGTLDEKTLVHASFAALDIIGQRRRELPDLVAVARATPDGKFWLEVTPREVSREAAREVANA